MAAEVVGKFYASKDDAKVGVMRWAAGHGGKRMLQHRSTATRLVHICALQRRANTKTHEENRRLAEAAKQTGRKVQKAKAKTVCSAIHEVKKVTEPSSSASPALDVPLAQ